MARQGIFTGSSPNDGTGDSLLVGASKINQNFSEIYSAFGNGNNLESYVSSSGISTVSQGLTGTPNITVNKIVAGLTSSIIPFLWEDYADLPPSGSYHGAFAHVHETGKAYYAHGGWVELVNTKADRTVGTGTENYNVGVITATSFFGDGSQLTGIGTNSGGSGIALTALSVIVNDVGLSTLSYNNSTGVFAFTPPNLTGYATTDSIVGFITAGALTGAGGTWTVNESGIHTTKNVGIGTTNPTSKLHVVGDVLITGLSTFRGNLTFSDSGSKIIFPASSYSSQSAYINLYTSSNTSATIGGSNTGRLSIFNTTVNNQPTSIDIRTDQHLLSDSSGNYYALLSSGSVSLYHITGGTANKKFETLGTGITVTGSVSATSFIGDGSNLTGIAASFTGAASTITSGQILNWDTSYSWGDHSSAGYATSLNLDDLSDVNVGAPTTGQVLKWSGSEWQASADLTTSGTGIGLSDLSVTINPVGINSLTYNNATGVFLFTPTSLVGYATEGYVTTQIGLNTFTGAASTITTTQISNWDTAYGWGDHASAGYLTDVNITAGSNITVLETSEGNFIITSTAAGTGAGTTWSINSAGIHTTKNVGIGTTLSSSTLTVEGNGRFSGIVTASRFESASAGTPTIDSPNNLNINAVTVAISTDVTIGDELRVAGITTIGPGGIRVAGIVTAQSFVGNITGNLTGTASFATVAGIATYTSEWILGAVGNSDYTFTGPGFTGAESDPVLYLVRGQQYKFTNTMGAHSFRIQSTPNGSTGTQYDDGIVNNNVSNGTLTWNVQFDAPGLLYYQCTAHGDMGGKIYIIDAGIGPDISINTTGIITATSFIGNGSGLTNVSAAGTDTLQSITDRESITTQEITASNFRSNDTVGNGSDVGFAIKYYITSSGSSAYRFAGPGLVNTTDNPTLYLHRGFTYIFENSTGGSHPFAIKYSSGGTGYGSTYLSGSLSGTQVFTVPFDAPATLVYQCALHSGMLGTFNIVT